MQLPRFNHEYQMGLVASFDSPVPPGHNLSYLTIWGGHTIVYLNDPKDTKVAFEKIDVGLGMGFLIVDAVYAPKPLMPLDFSSESFKRSIVYVNSRQNVNLLEGKQHAGPIELGTINAVINQYLNFLK